MNKTIEREFYVSDDIKERIERHDSIDYYGMKNEKYGRYSNKIKIIIEVPKKKVTISESEFDDAMRASLFGKDPLEFAKNIKQKLFSGDEG